MNHATQLLLAEKDKEIARLTRENASLRQEAARQRESISPAHTVSDASTLLPDGANITLHCDVSGITLVPVRHDTQHKHKQPRKALEKRWSSVAARVNRLHTKLSGSLTNTFKRKQNPALPSGDWPVEESAPTGRDRSPSVASSHEATRDLTSTSRNQSLSAQSNNEPTEDLTTTSWNKSPSIPSNDASTEDLATTSLDQSQEAEVSSDDQSAEELTSTGTGWDQSSATVGGNSGTEGSDSWENDSTDPEWAKNTSDNPWGVEEGCQWEPDEPVEEPKWRSSELPPTTKFWLHDRSWKQPHTMDPERLKHIVDQHALVPATRLNDDDWVRSDLRSVRVEDLRLYRLAVRGKELAQKIIWEHADKHDKRFRDQLWPGGWQQVKVEVVELTNQMGTNRAKSFFTWRDNDAYNAFNLLLREVVPLRHFVCHWDRHQGMDVAPVVESKLKSVQQFAILLGNGPRAMEARMIRDELRQAVKDTVTEVEELDRVAVLEELSPTWEACNFKLHHVEMFEFIEEEKRSSEPEELVFPEVILSAAEAWARRRDEALTAPGQEGEDQSDDKDKKICRRNTFSGRRGSLEGADASRKRRDSFG